MSLQNIWYIIRSGEWVGTPVWDIFDEEFVQGSAVAFLCTSDKEPPELVIRKDYLEKVGLQHILEKLPFITNMVQESKGKSFRSFQRTNSDDWNFHEAVNYFCHMKAIKVNGKWRVDTDIMPTRYEKRRE